MTDSNRVVARRRPSGRWFVSPYPLLMLCGVLWGSNMVAGRAVHTLISPATLSFGRWLVAMAVLLPFAGFGLIAQRHVIAREWRLLVGLGGVGGALFHTLVYAALNRTTAVNAGLIMSITPVVIVAMSWAIFRDRITARQGFGIAASLVGVAVILLRGEPARLFRLELNLGDVWMLLAVPAWAYYSVVLRRRPPELSPLSLLTTTAIVALLMLLPLTLLERAVGAPLTVDRETIAAVVYLGLFATVVAFVFWNRAVAEVGANAAGHFLHLIPASSVLLGVVLLGEPVFRYHLAGIALIACGILLANSRRAERARRDAATGW
jgi:drug/metabolite transporter (DMT)-like permease